MTDTPAVLAEQALRLAMGTLGNEAVTVLAGLHAGGYTIVRAAGLREAPLDADRLAKAMWDALSHAGVLRIHADGWKELNDIATSVAAEYDRTPAEGRALDRLAERLAFVEQQITNIFTTQALILERLPAPAEPATEGEG